MKFPSLAEIMATFLKFELVFGWTSESPNITQTGNKFDIFATEGPWTFVDEWVGGDHYAEQGWTHGNTILAYDSAAVMTIQFQGFYPNEVIQRVVAPALRQTFQSGIFYGGRGISYGVDNFGYENCVSGVGYSDEFHDLTLGDPHDPRRVLDFHGCEKVRDFAGSPGELVGFHKYQGGVTVRALLNG